MLTVERLETGPVTVLRLAGELDEGGMNELRLGLVRCQQDGVCRVVVNMSAVTFVSYMGVGVLVEGVRQMRKGGGDLKLSEVNVYTQRLLRMCSVNKLFATFASEPEAIAAFRMAA